MKILDLLGQFIREIPLENIMLVLIVITVIFGGILKVDYFNFGEVFKGYLNVFRDNYGRLNIIGVLIDLLLPLWIAIYVVCKSPNYKSDYQAELMVVTIITALLFSVFGLAFDLKSKINDKKMIDKLSASKKKNLIQIIESLIDMNLFEIAISVTILILCFVSNFCNKYANQLRCMIYYLLFLLLINIFIIFKRMQRVFNEIKDG